MGHTVTVNPEDPISVGVCDHSGFVVPRNELVKNMQFRGNSLVWDGTLVWYKFADVPNAQQLSPILPPDPVPVKLPRPDNQMNQIPWSLQPTPWMWVTEEWSQWGYQG